MDMLKVPTLRKELERITSNPEIWNQATWWDVVSSSENICGTKGCLAGNAIHNSTTFTIVECGVDDFVPQRISTGQRWDWEQAGADVLGLTEQEATILFSPSQSLYGLWVNANKFSNGEIEVPPSLYAPSWAPIEYSDDELLQ